MIKIVFLCLTISSFMLANEAWLSKQHQEILAQEKHSSVLEKSIKENDWISPISAQASFSKSDTKPGDSSSLHEISLSLNQDIYRFGGINAIKKQALYGYQYTTANLKIRKHKMIADILYLSLQIQQSLLIQKQTNYSINNQKITIIAREEGYTKGVNDILEVDNAHIELSSLQENLENEKIREIQLKESLAKLSNWDYKIIQSNVLQALNLPMFIANNNINAANLEIKLKKEIAKEQEAANFPTISLFGTVSRQKETKDYTSSNNLGLKLSWSWDINRDERIQQSRINTMMAKSQLGQKKYEERLFFNRVIKEQERIERKIDLHKKTLKRYENLYARTKELINNNLGIPEDLIVIDNTLKTKQVATKIEKLNQELLLVQLYRHTSLSL